MIEQYNIILAGVGGQGVIRLGKIIGEAASMDNYKNKHGWTVKSSEIHAMAQRGGSIDCDVRFGTKIYSPLVPINKADLIVSLELIEGLREKIINFAKPDKSTIFLVNIYKDIPQSVTKGEEKYPPLEEITKAYNTLSNHVFLVHATKIAAKLGDAVMTNIAMLGVMANYIPINIESIEDAIKENVPKSTLETNLQVFNKGLNYKI